MYKRSLKLRSDEQKISVRNSDCDKNETAKHSWKPVQKGSEEVIYRRSRLIPRKIKETIHSLKNPNHIDKISCMHPEIWLIITASVKLYCLITLICLIILISHIAQLYLIHKFYCFCPVRIFSLSMSSIIIYVTR